jgi:glycosyl transferase family 87
VPSRLGLLVRPLVFALIVVGLYGLLRLKRAELIDFAVPRRTAVRFLAHEPLYRPEDGHYQYKYFPTFALAMVPFTWMPKEVAEFTWFTLTVAMTWALLHLSLAALPDRRMSAQTLFWLTLLLNGKFLVKELTLGQFNLPVALLLLGAVIAAQHRRVMAAGALVAAGVFVKPYALVLAPWLAWRLGWRSLVAFGLVLAAGLALPAVFYGWNGNLTLLHEWYRTVSQTTGPNLMTPENISFASMWAKWIEPGPMAGAFALASSVAAVATGLVVMFEGRRVPDPNYLEVAYFLVLVPLLSPQGWDYVLVIAMPAYTCLVDRWREITPTWRAVTLTGFFLTSFTIFDLLRRSLYTHLMHASGVSVGAVLIAICLIHLRSRASA